MNSERRSLLVTLFLLALTATVLHMAAHPMFASDAAHPGASVFRPAFVAASVLPLLDLVVVTWLFSARRTAAYGYLLNGLLVIYGTVLMGHFGIAALAGLAAKARRPPRAVQVDGHRHRHRLGGLLRREGAL